MAEENRTGRYLTIAVLLVAAVIWSLATAAPGNGGQDYPNAQFLATPSWLAKHIDDPDVVVVDVRRDKYFDNRVIPGAVRMPWSLFRQNDPAQGLGGIFVGIDRAQQILGEHGIARTDTVVLYDSVQRDGGATASYVFWILDMLGHGNKRILERGIDGWADAGGKVVSEPATREAMLYQAPLDELRLRRGVDGSFIYQRLGDPYYQILDVRSRAEYLGEKPDIGLDGKVLKLGHIPTASNVNYTLNWAGDSKALKTYADLQGLYAGLDPDKAVITYCHSARRGSFGYFVLRLMGFSDVILYDNSWFEWGSQKGFFPVETTENPLAGAVPQGRRQAMGSGDGARPAASSGAASGASGPSGGGGDRGGYVSCGG